MSAHRIPEFVEPPIACVSVAQESIRWRDDYEAVRDVVGMLRVTTPDSPIIQRLWEISEWMLVASQSADGSRLLRQ